MGQQLSGVLTHCRVLWSTTAGDPDCARGLGGEDLIDESSVCDSNTHCFFSFTGARPGFVEPKSQGCFRPAVQPPPASWLPRSLS